MSNYTIHMPSILKKLFPSLLVLVLISTPNLVVHALVPHHLPLPPEPIIFTESDLENFSFPNRNSQAQTFYLQINKNIPAYTFQVVSFSTSTGASGYIEISRGINTKPIQKIMLDPNQFMADEVSRTFTAHDINFDGYLDIGVVVDGGAKWASFQYWIFNPNTGKFVNSALAKDFRNINFNQIKFDPKNKQIQTNNMIGTLTAQKTIYQFQNNRLRMKVQYLQDQQYNEDTNLPIEKCVITTKNYGGGRVKTSEETKNKMCEGYYDGLK